MNLFRLCGLTIVVIGWLAPAASAEPIMLASIPIQVNFGYPAVEGTGEGRFWIGFPRVAQLFESRLITAADVGGVIVADASTDPAFGAFAQRATNGRADFTEWLLGPAGGGGAGTSSGSEGAVFRLPAGVPDFHGSTLAHLALSVDELTFAPDPTMPEFERLLFTGRLSVFGEGGSSPVPEPGTMLLLGGGVAAALLRARRRRAIDTRA
jgi:PEP-CTERM motif